MVVSAGERIVRLLAANYGERTLPGHVDSEDRRITARLKPRYR
jgi:hypothetical protein